jgi:Mce-associated membrane protein
VSDPNRPVRRRRIAGEGRPTPPAPAPSGRATAKKATVRRPLAKKPDAPRPMAPERPAAPVATPRPRTEPARAASDPKPDRARPSWQLVLATVVAAVVLVGGAFYAWQGIADARSGGDDLAKAQSQASSAAGSAAETIFSFRYDELDDHLTTSKALMTPKFRTEFDKVAPGLTNLAPQRKIVVEAVTRAAAPLSCGGECSDSKVNVMVFVDQARLIGSSTQPTVFGNRITVAMVKRDGTWLVDDIRAL